MVCILNLKELENLNTKEELIQYFKTNGQSITEKGIEALKEKTMSKVKK